MSSEVGVKGWLIFKHALRQVTGNLGPALRVSLLPFVGMILLSAVVVLALMATAYSGTEPTALAVFAAVIAVLAYMLMLGTIAVNWHRFVLLNEPIGWLPSLRFNRIGAYLWRYVLVFLLCALAGVGLAIPAGLLSSGGSALAIGLFVVLMVVILMPLFLRLSASLPGAAVDGGQGIQASWAATAGETVTFLALSLIFLVFLLLTGIAAQVVGMIPVLGLLAQIAFNWFSTMLGLSVLTTIYGHYVEKRPLL